MTNYGWRQPPGSYDFIQSESLVPTEKSNQNKGQGVSIGSLPRQTYRDEGPQLVRYHPKYP